MAISGISFSASFYPVKKPASAVLPAPKPEGSPAPSKPTDEFIFSSKAEDLLNRRSISDLDRKQLASLFARASGESASADPKAFLKSLSYTEMDLLRRAHSLADRINIDTLTAEGAQNLLVEPGAAQDLDNNGLTMIGAANTIVFPPRSAPESFKKAWADATAGMDPMEVPMHLPFSIGLANLHVDASGKVTSVEPDDPKWVNPFADPNYDYSGNIRKVVSGIEFSHARGLISDDRYKLDMAFYRKLQAGIEKYQEAAITHS